MTRQAERMENLRRDGTTFTNRHKDEDWLDKISRSNHKEKLILAEVSLATKGIDDDGNFYYDIDPDGEAYNNNLRKNDMINEINRTPIKNITDYNNETKKYLAGDVIMVRIIRDGSNIYEAFENYDETRALLVNTGPRGAGNINQINEP